MEQFREKIELALKTLPMSLPNFINSIELPKSENCFEFSYFKTFINILNLFKKEDADIMVFRKKDTTHYKSILVSSFTLSNPDNEENKFDGLIQMFSNGVGDHIFAKIGYDGKTLFIDRVDGGKLNIPILLR